MVAGPHRLIGQPVVVLGEFDGFHLGHRQLVHQAGLLAARMRRPLVAAVLVAESGDALLTTVEERCWALLASGASNVHAVSIASAGHADAGSLVVDGLIARLDPTVVVMACLPTDAASARYPSLRAEFARRAPELVEVPRWNDPDGQYVTSSRVRAALRRGEVVAANDWLGRTFTLTGKVVHGSGLGRTIGFPTANLDLAPNRLVPMNGVYAGVVDLPNGEQHRAAINIGVRPTVEDGRGLARRGTSARLRRRPVRNDDRRRLPAVVAPRAALRFPRHTGVSAGGRRRADPPAAPRIRRPLVIGRKICARGRVTFVRPRSTSLPVQNAECVTC